MDFLDISLWATSSTTQTQKKQDEKIFHPQYKFEDLPQLNCSESFLCSSSFLFPSTKELLQISKLPLCIEFEPFHNLNKDDQINSAIPHVHFENQQVPRCKCGAYINSFVTWSITFESWTCNFCAHTNETPIEYLNSMNKSNQNEKQQQQQILHNEVVQKLHPRPLREELFVGQYQFHASEKLIDRQPQPAVYWFVIDVSRPMIASGALPILCSTIKKAVFSLLNHKKSKGQEEQKEELLLDGDLRTRIGFITHNAEIQLWLFKKNRTKPRMCVLTDPGHIKEFSQSGGLLVPISKFSDMIFDFLDLLPQMFKNQRERETEIQNKLTDSLLVSWNVIQNFGGKLIAFQSQLPAWGKYPLRNRLDPKLIGTVHEPKLYSQANEQNVSKFFNNFPMMCLSKHVSVDMFLINSNYMDIASISNLSKKTAGNLFRYENFQDSISIQNSFQSDLLNLLKQKKHWEGLIKIRTSSGLKVSKALGNCIKEANDIIRIPVVMPDFSVFLELDLNDTITFSRDFFLQTAILYSNSEGERKVRIYTKCLPIGNNLSAVFKTVNIQVLFGYFVKRGIEQALNETLINVRQKLMLTCENILMRYFQTKEAQQILYQNKQKGIQSLVLIQSLNLLPLCTVGFIKNYLFCSLKNVNVDYRSYLFSTFNSQNSQAIMSALCPHFYQILDENSIKNNSLQNPNRLSLTQKNIEPTKIYLLTNGIEILIYVGQQVNQLILKDLFSINRFEDLKDISFDFNQLNNRLNKFVWGFISYLNKLFSKSLKIKVIKQGGIGDDEVFRLLIEDRTQTARSYPQFIEALYQKVSKIQNF
ncbi:sec24-related protein [Anaeramoeba flamelloides]|uniref:Sec24-related protein n=1 Tax=Anaeramoeba flamelloides TaxID=1746091 RepID=A0ABQ8YAU9_9EUKA|nr:sec24-related protein [Anaeramoeba flamelloides]